MKLDFARCQSLLPMEKGIRSRVDGLARIDRKDFDAKMLLTALQSSRIDVDAMTG